MRHSFVILPCLVLCLPLLVVNDFCCPKNTQEPFPATQLKCVDFLSCIFKVQLCTLVFKNIQHFEMAGFFIRSFIRIFPWVLVFESIFKAAASAWTQELLVTAKQICLKAVFVKHSTSRVAVLLISLSRNEYMFVTVPLMLKWKISECRDEEFCLLDLWAIWSRLAITKDQKLIFFNVKGPIEFWHTSEIPRLWIL